MMSAARVVVPVPRLTNVSWSRAGHPHHPSHHNERPIGPVHGHASIFMNSRSSLAASHSVSTSATSFGSIDPQPTPPSVFWRTTCVRVCPTIAYLIINLVWMTSGIAGIALGNLVNKRYFSILLVSIFGLLIAVIYRFFYDLEHMDTTPNPPTTLSSPPTPASRRSLPPCYSTVIRSETPPPTYAEYLAMVHANQLANLCGKPTVQPLPTISSVVGNNGAKSSTLTNV